MALRPGPANLRCRDLPSLRACLTIFRAVDDGDVLDWRQATWIDLAALAILHYKAQHMRPSVVQIMLPNLRGPRDYMLDQLRSAQEGQNKYSLRQPNRLPVRYVRRERDMGRELDKWRKMLMESEAVSEEVSREFASTMAEVLTNSFTHGETSRPCILGGANVS